MNIQSKMDLLANGSARAAIDGLGYQSDWITADEEQRLVASVDTSEWLTDLARRVQHYGYKYDYQTRRIDETMYLGPLSDWLQPLAQRLVAEGVFAARPDQVIVNEYLPGQGIQGHVDCPPCFGDTVVSLSLLSGCLMDLTREDPPSRVSVWLAERSIVVLKGSARYEWRHSIARRQHDQIGDEMVPRHRRISLTFRNAI